MAKVVVDRDRSYAPIGYLICLVGSEGNWNTRDENQTVLVDTDWDYPGLASSLGYVPCPDCGDTDGTVDCAHRTADEMITAAADFLKEHLGEVFEDPGYFQAYDCMRCEETFYASSWELEYCPDCAKNPNRLRI